MLQNNFKIIAVMMFLGMCLLSTTADADSRSLLEVDNTDEDFPDLYLDNQENEDLEDSLDLNKRAVPRLRRIFIGKRTMSDLDDYMAKRSNYRRHIFIGKRDQMRFKKQGRIHRIFIG